MAKIEATSFMDGPLNVLIFLYFMGEGFKFQEAKESDWDRFFNCFFHKNKCELESVQVGSNNTLRVSNQFILCFQNFYQTYELASKAFFKPASLF